ncbi:GGDEF domain-containing protein [uncultured Microbacterium sp.]|uniref:GGDEF domain-containing protein n=1 Tax=uncultured Microbacterium sp. TaxID=191216 RepID=UPI002627BEC9|nr:GGDEF domain-containing protein [uncultured Microbacterium sp.]
MIESSPMTALVALSTLCTALFIGLGFLPRPSRAGAIWTSAFGMLMTMSYGWVAADLIESPPLRGAASGLMFSTIALVWVGLRVRRAALRSHGVVAAAAMVIMPVLLVVTAETDLYLTAVRAVFTIAAVFAGLILAELVRLGPLLRDEVLPLAMTSAAFVIFAVINVVLEGVRLARGGAGPEQIALVRDVNTLGALLYVVCAAVTLLLLTRDHEPVRGAASDSTFTRVARDRLRRAEAADDKWWALLIIRLDDPTALREASSMHAFDQVRARFADVVQGLLPAEADIDLRDGAEVVVLLPRPEGAVRQILAHLLENVATTESDLAVRLSASVGWAGVDVVGYDLDALISEAADAATLAQERGGDRWFRVTVG